MLRRRKEETPRSLYAGSLLTRLLRTGPDVHRATVRRYGFRPYSINNLINLCLSYGSGRSAAKAAMLTCAIFWNSSSKSSLTN